MRALELLIETIIFNSRWILAPFYIGLVIGLVLLFVHFSIELTAFILKIHIAGESEVILGILGLIDLVFVGNLVLIVIFSGYENFVSKIEASERDRPDWMTKVDFGGLKQKLMTSIVAISAIQLLKAFMNVDQYSTTKLTWVTVIHVVFLFSLLAVTLSDRLGEATKHSSETRRRK
ncbi:MAG: TIGR00645 family protein [Rhizobiales bacterium]|nr:TIGR00645 family protein [Hyphomicrobiales bacterium]